MNYIQLYTLAICLVHVCRWYCCICQSNLFKEDSEQLKPIINPIWPCWVLNTICNLESSSFPPYLLLLFLFFILLFFNCPHAFLYSLLPFFFFFLSPSFLFFLSSSLFCFYWMQWYVVLYMAHSSFVLIFYCLYKIKVSFKVDVSYFGETGFC